MLTYRGYIKLIDFGFAKRTIQLTLTMCGTLQFMSSEIIFQEKYNKWVDFWASGVLTYELLTVNHHLMVKIMKNYWKLYVKILFILNQQYFQELLTRNPHQRLDCMKNNSSDILYHLWFQQSLYSFNQLEQQSIPTVNILSNLIDYTDYPLKFIEIRLVVNSINEKSFENLY